jgi:hypothetical protein
VPRQDPHITQTAIPTNVLPQVQWSSLDSSRSHEDRGRAAQVAIVLVSVGIPCLIAFTYYTVDRRLKASVKRQLAAVAAMAKCDPNDAEWTQHAVRMFEAFDTDLSGEIDQKEMRELIELVHPKIPRRLAKEATLEAKVHADHEGQLTTVHLSMH